MPEQPADENQEALILSKVIRHVAENLSKGDASATEGQEDAYIELLSELATGFEETGGIEFTADQAQPLANTFALLETAIKALSQEAHQGGHHNAAAKLEWAALVVNGFTASLQECHLKEQGGSLAI